MGMTTHLTTTLTTVNAPYSVQLDGQGLASCLLDIQIAKAHSGQVSAFLGEVPLQDQLEFADAYMISIEVLKSFAKSFSNWSGESYLLAA